MGAWGEGPFDNDGSHDAIAGLRDVDQEAAEAHIRQVFRDVLEQDYVECYEAQGAIGVAVLLTHLDSPLPDPDIVRSAEGIELTVTAELRELAARGLRRLQNPADNEWFELWDEGGGGFGETMSRSLDRFLDALNGRSAETRPVN
ncbi:DUF4259 domain-containing protein [Nocardia shimofusensis]|uniref:DUF4259 domain-containing protein n=1 Tax=Nocardia shimofusensis TaxID=228596 RepID=UPI00082FA598|nr:DUF4259 domain-containing protein [Nocardia shimofusensis]